MPEPNRPIFTFTDAELLMEAEIQRPFASKEGRVKGKNQAETIQEQLVRVPQFQEHLKEASVWGIGKVDAAKWVHDHCIFGNSWAIERLCTSAWEAMQRAGDLPGFNRTELTAESLAILHDEIQRELQVTAATWYLMGAVAGLCAGLEPEPPEPKRQKPRDISECHEVEEEEKP